MAVKLGKIDFVDAALNVVNQVGVEKLSMRKVATVLGVSPMAVYKHFANKEELLAAALEEFIGRASVFPDSSLPWQQWVSEVAEGMYKALCEEVSWIPLLGRLRLGETAAAVTDAFIEKLTAAGFTLEQSLMVFFSVIQVAIGAACLKTSLQQNEKSEEDVSPLTAVYLEKLSSKRIQVAPLLEQVSQVDPLETSLPVFIAGLESMLVANGQ